jgi:hypothetical protein
VLEHGTGDELADPAVAGQLVAFDESVERRSEQLLVGAGRVGTVRACEGDTAAADDGDAADAGTDEAAGTHPRPNS